MPRACTPLARNARTLEHHARQACHQGTVCICVRVWPGPRAGVVCPLTARGPVHARPRIRHGYAAMAFVRVCMGTAAHAFWQHARAGAISLTHAHTNRLPRTSERQQHGNALRHRHAPGAHDSSALPRPPTATRLATVFVTQHVRRTGSGSRAADARQRHLRGRKVRASLSTMLLVPGVVPVCTVCTLARLQISHGAGCPVRLRARSGRRAKTAGCRGRSCA